MAFVSAYIIANRLGMVYAAETGYVISRDPDTVLAPDFSFIKRGRLLEYHPKSYLEVPPDLVIETRSIGDSDIRVKRKIDLWLDFGVGSVWDLNPLKQTVTIDSQDRTQTRYGVDDTLVDNQSLPGFSLALVDLFKYDQTLSG